MTIVDVLFVCKIVVKILFPVFLCRHTSNVLRMRVVLSNFKVKVTVRFVLQFGCAKLVLKISVFECRHTPYWLRKRCRWIGLHF